MTPEEQARADPHIGLVHSLALRVTALERVVLSQQDRLAALERLLPKVERPVGGCSVDRPEAVQAPVVVDAVGLVVATLLGVDVAVEVDDPVRPAEEPECLGCQ